MGKWDSWLCWSIGLLFYILGFHINWKASLVILVAASFFFVGNKRAKKT